MMPNPVHQNDVQITRVHSGAICEEIGERLSAALGPQSNVLSPRLLALIKQLAKVEPRERPRKFDGIERMKDFANVSFAPDTIKTMTTAMNRAIAALPHPVSSAHVQSVAETILRTAKDGERDPKVLERMALLELQISPRF
jgi:hypothetical protein